MMKASFWMRFLFVTRGALMNRLRLFLNCTLGALANTCAAVGPPELLFNGNLSLPVTGMGTPTGWTAAFTPPGTPSARLISFANHNRPLDPDGYGWWLQAFFGGGGAPPVTAHLTQSVPATPGMTYTFSGWSLFEQNYAGGVNVLSPASPGGATASPTDTVFALEFYDMNSLLLAAFSKELKADGQTNTQQWRQHTVTGLAPAGTTSVVVRASMLNGVFNVDPMMTAFVDDFSLTAVPEPTAATLVLAGLAVAIRRRGRRT